ncbi:MAG: S1C family serine protease [Rhizomicrobium sp.]
MTPLKQFSDALVVQANAARSFVAEIRAQHCSHRSGTLWRPDIVVASEQSLPKAETFEVAVAGSEPARASLSGRDPGTNVAVLKLDRALAGVLPARADAQTGMVTLAFGADGHGGVTVRFGTVCATAPEWRSRAGGKIDRRIVLDLALSPREDGGPVLDVEGRLLGISTLGHADSVLAIPHATVERSVEALLTHGRVERGWLGVALHPVAIPDAWRETAEEKTGLMVMSAASEGPAAGAGVLPGDILLGIDGARTSHACRLAERLGAESVGREIELGVLRSGTRLSLRAVVATRPDNA